MFSSKRQCISLALVGVAVATAAPARAEVTLNDGPGWQIFSDGRINGFVSYVNGDGYPIASKDANGNQVALRGGGLIPDDAAIEPNGSGTDAMGNPLQGK